MPNIVLTSLCNRSCEYCFAMEASKENENRYIDFQEIVNIADKICATPNKFVGLLGGEPTLHPQFCEILMYMIERGIFVSVFTNGICSDSVLNKLERLRDRGGHKYIVNTNPPSIESEQNQIRQDLFLRRFAVLCDISVNVFKPDISLDFVRDVAQRNGLKNSKLRVGIAQPIVGESNSYLPLESYPRAAANIVHMSESVWDRNISVHFDCGFPLCAFTDEQLGKLIRMNAGLRFFCDMALDFGPGLNAWSCFPMVKQCYTSYDAYESMDQLAGRLKDRILFLRGQQTFGLYAECRDCIYRKNKVCAGGCFSHAINIDRDRTSSSTVS